MLRLYKVNGHSMEPRFKSGDYLLLIRSKRPVKSGQCLVYRHPKYGDIFKVVSGIEPRAEAAVHDKPPSGQQFQLNSLNPAGINEAEIGLCYSDNIIGKLLFHFAQ